MMSSPVMCVECSKFFALVMMVWFRVWSFPFVSCEVAPLMRVSSPMKRCAFEVFDSTLLPKHFWAVFPCQAAVKVAREGLGGFPGIEYGSGCDSQVWFPGRGRRLAATRVLFQA